jgi:hypothetical protein
MKAELNKDFSSKLKRVFIELHNYSFSHGTNGIGNSDSRFIGRESLIEKLKSVLTNTDKKSGIYLVTGYRGMGKTSFVAKVLEELYSQNFLITKVLNWITYFISSYLITVLLIVFSSRLFKYQEAKDCLIITFIVYLLILLMQFILYFGNNEKFSALIKSVIVGPNKSIKKIAFLRRCIVVSIFSLLSCLIIYFVSDKKSGKEIEVFIYYLKWILFGYTISFFTICLINYIIWIIDQPKKREKLEHKRKFSDYLFHIINPIKRYINSSSKIIINLNLGHSNLKEIIVLKLIARNLKSSFKLHQQKFSASKLLRYFNYFFIFIFTFAIYNLDPIKKFNSSLKSSLGINTLFPSQNDIFLTSNSPLLGTIVGTMHKNEKFNAKNYNIYIKAITGNIFQNDSINMKLNYLNNFDQNLSNFLNTDSLEKLPYKEFKNEFQLREDAFFNVLENYDEIKRNKINDNANLDSLYMLNSGDILNLITYNEENKNLLISKNNIDIMFLYRLNKLADLYNIYNSYSPLKRNIISLSNYVDFFFYQGYYYARSVLPITDCYIYKAHMIPIQVDYLYFLYILTFLYFLRIVQRIYNHNKPTLKSVSSKLNFINDLIDSSLTFENAIDFNIPKIPYSYSKKKSQSYTKADEREIEKHLIEIIDDISHLPINSYRSEVIIVFDELDKIEPFVDKLKENAQSARTSESPRSRLQTVMGLLSNLKYFLSTAQAKFIFIAGREMFDASLADVSDRNFRIGSIFHDIFYVSSFYSDIAEYDIEDITSRTEQFLCQFLLPGFNKKSTLRDYNRYLKSNKSLAGEFDEDFDNSYSIEDKIIAKQKREKIIYLLQHFIVYLNHQSAGAPSKITAYFEDHIVTKEMFKPGVFDNSIVAGNRESNGLFLYFDYYGQYELGLINYLITPFNYSINKAIRSYGDKLIISASFLHNHLFKFHRNAFSWRDLESTPEIVDINKNPELRDFLSRMMELLLNGNIQKIIYGIYDFKFPKKISQELLFLSHISEESSASLNFTLDESLTIKQFYKDQLLFLKSSHTPGSNESEAYIFSVASMNLTIADLCFYDGDYGEAIQYYLDAIQPIRNRPVNDLTITQLVLLTRNMLKLGHALEKRKTYDSAQLTYCEISNIIFKKLHYSVDDLSSLDFIKSVLNNVNYLYQPLLAKLHLIEKASIDGLKESDLTKIYDEYKTIKATFNVVDSKDSTNRENNNCDDKYLIEAEFWNKIGNLLYFKNTIVQNETQCPYSILNKNSIYKTCSACRKYFDSLNILLSKHDIHFMINSPEGSNLYTINLFIISIKDLINTHELKKITNLEYRILAMLLSNVGDINLCCSSEREINPDFLNEIDKCLSNLNYLSHINFQKNSQLEVMLFSYLCSAYFFRHSDEYRSASNQYNKILSFFKEFTHQQKGSLQTDLITSIIQKIADAAIKDIYISNEQIHIYEIEKFKKTLESDANSLYSKNISLRRISLNSDLDEINLNTECILLNVQPNSAFEKTSFLKLFSLVTPYMLNTNMYSQIIHLRFRARINEIILKQMIGLTSNQIEFIDLSKIFIRNLDIKFELICENTSFIDAFEFLISDTIYCHFETIKLFNTFDKSFSLNYSLLAESHRSLWILSECFSAYMIFLSAIKKLKENKSNDEVFEFIKAAYPEIENSKTQLLLAIDSIKKSNYYLNIFNSNTSKKLYNTIEELIEPHNLQFISPVYQCEKALDAYYSVKYTHQQGQIYKNLIDNMYYLNDDFNDELYHFSVALERYLLNIGYINEQINMLEARTKNSGIYDHDNYLRDILTN